MAGASRYRVVLCGVEHDIVVEGDVARIGDIEVRIAPGAIPGTTAIESSGRRWTIVHETEGDGRRLRALLRGKLLEAEVRSERDLLRAVESASSAKGASRELRSVIPGIVRRVLRQVGDTVDDGEPILTLEAMKMENEVRADVRGRIAALHVEPGRKVNSGETLAVIEPE